MKVEAYRCDYCGRIKDYHAITGIYPIEDMFDKQRSYPVCPDPAKTNVHFCTECYNKVVIEKARTVDRRNDERLYELKVKELGFLIRSACVRNVMTKKIFVTN